MNRVEEEQSGQEEETDSLQRFVDEIRALERRLTELEQRNRELRETNERLKSDLEALTGTTPPALKRKAWDSKATGTELDAVENDVKKNREAIRGALDELKDLKSPSQDDAANRIERRYIRGAWDPSGKYDRRAKLVYVELLKKRKETFPDGRVLKVLSMGDILAMLGERELKPAYRELSISSYQEAKRVAQQVVELGDGDVFLAETGFEKIRRKDAAGNKRLMRCLAVEVVT